MRRDRLSTSAASRTGSVLLSAPSSSPGHESTRPELRSASVALGSSSMPCSSHHAANARLTLPSSCLRCAVVIAALTRSFGPRPTALRSASIVR
eukprot:7390542-Prymnesium_polylepis.4